MSEVEVNGASTSAVELDFAATKKALASSSTALRTTQLHAIEERIHHKCELDPKLVPAYA